MPDEVWQRFGETARAAGTDRAALLREFIAWYIGAPDAKLPRRRRRKTGPGSP